MVRWSGVGAPSPEPGAGPGRVPARSMRLVLRSVGTAVAAGLLLAGCPDPVEYDGLYITNLREGRIQAYLVRPDGSERLLTRRDPNSTGEVRRLRFVDTDSNDCSDFPISIRQRGVEIQRFEPPVCWDDGYEILTVR